MEDLYIYQNTNAGKIHVAIPLPPSLWDPEKGKHGRLKEVQLYPSQYDGDFGKTLEAARELRDKLATQYWGEDWRLRSGMGLRVPKRKVRSDSKSLPSEPGVWFNGKAWVASWSDWSSGTKKQRQKHFSVKKLGYDNAQQMATEARHKGIQESLLRPRSPLPRLSDVLVRSGVIWKVVWGRETLASFKDADYEDLEGRPGSWWAFIEAIDQVRTTEIKECGHTQVRRFGSWLKKTYEDLMQ